MKWPRLYGSLKWGVLSCLRCCSVPPTRLASDESRSPPMVLVGGGVAGGMRGIPPAATGVPMLPAVLPAVLPPVLWGVTAGISRSPNPSNTWRKNIKTCLLTPGWLIQLTQAEGGSEGRRYGVGGGGHSSCGSRQLCIWHLQTAQWIWPNIQRHTFIATGQLSCKIGLSMTGIKNVSAMNTMSQVSSKAKQV